MSPRKLNIIVVLYTLSAFCLLGMGSVRQQLEEVRAAAQETQLAPNAEPAADEVAEIESRYSLRLEELEKKLTIWQVVAIVIFATASLLLIFKEQLVRHIPPPSK